MSLEGNKRSAEIRLGLVLCGGVSLAIYMNGICDEVFRCVRGRGIYGLLKQLTDSDIVVDILSGSSAGGLDAVLLATALCNASEFAKTATFWRDRADFEALLKPPPSHDSVLSGEYLQTQLAEALGSLMTARTAAADPHNSSFDELDLFITATDVNGWRSEQRDDAGHPIEVSDYRRLFWLKHRKGRKEPFHPRALQDGKLADQVSDSLKETNRRALAALGRITASFPAAFEPMIVDVPPAPRPGRMVEQASVPGSVDGRLALWGQLTKTAVLIDGGVLDNKPFTSTLEAIFSRLSDRPVTRYLLFVEPDPDEAVAQRKADARKAGARTIDEQRPEPESPVVPGLATVIAESLSTLPRYDSIAGDLRALSGHNAKLVKYQSLLDAAAASDATPPAAGAQRAAYDQARRCAVVETWTSAVFEEGGEPPIREQGRAGQRRLQASLEALTGLHQRLIELDVEFHLRRLFALTYYQVEPTRPCPADKVALRVPGEDELHIDVKLFALLNRQIELLLVVRSRLQRELARFGAERPEVAARLLDQQPASFWATLLDAIDVLFSSLDSPACYANQALPALDSCVTRADISRMAEAPASRPSGFSLAASHDFISRALATEPKLNAAYQSFQQLDEVIFPLEIASELHEKDLIRPVRLSPYNARRGLSRASAKLCGVQLANFGGFLKRSWRANDSMWGRLDAVCELTETLLDPVRLRQPDVRTKLSALERLDTRVDELFPTSAPEARSRLREWLARLTSRQPDLQDRAISELEDASVDGILEQLIQAGQLEILREDLANVLASDVVGSFWQKRAAQRRLAEAQPYLQDDKGAMLVDYFRTHYGLPQQGLSAVPIASRWKWGVGFALAFVQGLVHSRDRTL